MRMPKPSFISLVSRGPLLWALACAGALGVSPALGQSERAAPPEQSEEAPVLSGPEVSADAPPVGRERFGAPMNPEPGSMADRIPQRVFLRAVRDLERSEDASLRPTAEQTAQIRALQRAYEEEMRAFRAAHAEELGALRREAGEAMRDRAAERRGGGTGEEGERARRGREDAGPRGGDGDAGKAPGARGREGPPGAREVMSPERAAQAEKVREIMAKAPSPVATQAKMWDVLTEGQRAEVEKALEAFRAERRAQGERRLMERYREQAEGRFQEMDERAVNERGRRGADRSERGDGRRVPPEVRERLERLSPEERERLRSMSPEERRAFIRELMRGDL